MFDKVIRVLSYEIQKAQVFEQDVSEFQKAIKILRDGTGYIEQLGEEGDGQVTTIRFSEL